LKYQIIGDYVFTTSNTGLDRDTLASVSVSLKGTRTGSWYESINGKHHITECSASDMPLEVVEAFELIIVGNQWLQYDVAEFRPVIDMIMETSGEEPAYQLLRRIICEIVDSGFAFQDWKKEVSA